ncbi:leucine zipper transcription factor-like protein 1 [Panulirus ornatus]|uniref:leucine zipper transcription factor-like protein 1 n=1 Tax=Panulirus ornatus TaxID=150431 RepID=UPI003A85AED5
MSELGVNPAHQACMARFLRFTKYQRAQRLRSIDACFQDVKDTRLVEETYTSEEVTEMLDALADVVQAEVESELIHAARTNSLLLARLFQQAQKWHLELTVDTSDLENQELLEEIKKFEEQQARVMDKSSPKKRTLAPLQEGDGPLGLLQAEIQRLSQENADLTAKLQQTESKVTEVTKGKTEMTLDLQAARDELNKLKKNVTSRPTTEEVTELCDEVEKMRLQLATQKEVQEAAEDQLAKDLTSSKQTLLQVKAQLQLAEKELERKFSQTGAYQNMKKMLNKKNEQIKAMRKKLETYEPNSDEVIDD